MQPNYNELQLKISDVCTGYGYTKCNFCPLVSACLIERGLETGETQAEFTKRWEDGMAAEYMKQFPGKV